MEFDWGKYYIILQLVLVGVVWVVKQVTIYRNRQIYCTLNLFTNLQVFFQLVIYFSLFFVLKVRGINPVKVLNRQSLSEIKPQFYKTEERRIRQGLLRKKKKKKTDGAWSTSEVRTLDSRITSCRLPRTLPRVVHTEFC